MMPKLASALFRPVPEITFKNFARASIHCLGYKEYKTCYRNNVRELHYPMVEKIFEELHIKYDAICEGICINTFANNIYK